MGSKNKEMVQATEPKTVIIYQDDKGKEPFTEWLDSLRDQKGPSLHFETHRQAGTRAIRRLSSGRWRCFGTADIFRPRLPGIFW